MYSVIYSACSVHKEETTTIVQYLFGACTVHVRCIHDQSYSKEEQQTRPPSQLEWLWSRPIGKQY